MSMNELDVYSHGVKSDCCGASVYLNGICSSCKDHCMDKLIDCTREEQELYYVADDSGLVMLDDVDFETAYVYASKIDGCSAYAKI